MAANGNGQAGKLGAGVGTPLPAGTRATLEARLGADLSEVRVLNNSALPASMGVQAYTSGTDIHFATGAYQPDTPNGLELLAHEASHIQQQKGPSVDRG